MEHLLPGVHAPAAVQPGCAAEQKAHGSAQLLPASAQVRCTPAQLSYAAVQLTWTAA